MKASLSIIPALLAVTSAFAPLATASKLALDVNSTPYGRFVCSGCTMGWTFNVTSPVSVTALGLFDHASNGLADDHEVGLWNASNTLLSSVTVTNAGFVVSSGVTGIRGRWIFMDVADITLPVGQYVIGAFYPTGGDGSLMASPLTLASEITFGQNRYKPGSSLELPDFTSQGIDPSYFGPNLLIDPVPEPASFVLVAAGLATLLFTRRRAT